MLSHIKMTIIITMLLFAHNVFSKDNITSHSIEAALNSPSVQEQLAGISFYFGYQKYPKPEQIFQEFKTNTSASSFVKKDEDACQAAFLESLIELYKNAKKLGGNAVVEIHSIYQDIVTASEEEYRCGSGTIVAGVALRGTVVNLRD